ncbi:hypothetical protein GGR50DRAFT_641054 [Xylaria sp. CBS 124048]|nr:hypothetical protein GGR50DRAFT_641054 [Xylaria sp. CBS 124048]
MKSPLLYLLPPALATLVMAHAAVPPSAPVYILMPDSSPALRVLSSALDTLGYTQTSLPLSLSLSLSTDGTNAELGGTYAILTPGAEQYKNISRADPSARFILPLPRSESTGAKSNYDWLGTTKSREQQQEQQQQPQQQPQPWSGPAHEVDAIRAFFAGQERESLRLLELDVFASGSHEQAQTWVTLCEFLGLGYSVVERLKLWHFPK